jgi:hypothetical protein
MKSTGQNGRQEKLHPIQIPMLYYLIRMHMILTLYSFSTIESFLVIFSFIFIECPGQQAGFLYTDKLAAG